MTVATLTFLLLNSALAAPPTVETDLTKTNQVYSDNSLNVSASFDRETGLCNGPKITITDSQVLESYNEGGRHTIIECAVLTGSSGYANFKDQNLSGITFNGVTAESAVFENTNLHGSRLYGSFNAANFSSADLGESTLFGSYIAANFSGANLCGEKWQTNLQSANLSGADLTGIRKNNRTLLPGAKEMPRAKYEPGFFNTVQFYMD